MKHFIVALALLLSSASSAAADACDTLIGTVQGSLANQSIAPARRQQLEQLLAAGKSAKSQGNVNACQSALDGAMQSRPPGHKCEKTPDTV